MERVMLMTEQVQIKNINYCYDGKSPVLKNISLDIFAGEKIAVMGANGAGKSTFFLCLNGIILPDSGEILLYGKKIDKKNIIELRKNVSFVFQDADNQIVASTVLSEISFGPMNLKLPKQEVQKRVQEAMEYMNLTEFAQRGTHYLSGGEKKRVTIADSIAMKSNIILFDEPTTALDAVHQQMLENTLEQLAQQGKTIIVSTHDVDFAYRFAKRVILFCNGEIIADDTTENVFSNETILKKSNLKQPILLQLQKLLEQKGLLKQCNQCPKNIEDFKNIL